MSVRTATEVLISLEEKVDKLTKLIENYEFNLNLVSNKLNQLIKKQDQVVPQFKQQVSPVFVEAADVKKPTLPDTIKISNDNIQVDTAPVGQRRVSRKETYEKKPVVEPGFDRSPIQVPHGKGSKIIDYTPPDDELSFPEFQEVNPNNVIPVSQRVSFSDNKAMFMADVKVVNLPGLEEVHKGRTGGTGKWSATLKPGKYRVLISYRDRLTKESLSESMDFMIDGSKNPLEIGPIVFDRKG